MITIESPRLGTRIHRYDPEKVGQGISTIMDDPMYRKRVERVLDQKFPGLTFQELRDGIEGSNDAERFAANTILSQIEDELGIG